MTDVLGIKPTLATKEGIKWGGHDPGACLVSDGDIIAMAGEERFCRQKRAPRPNFPKKSIEFVLDFADKKLSDIDVIAIGRDQTKYLDEHTISSYIPGFSLDSINESYKNLKKRYIVNNRHQIDQVAYEISQIGASTFSGKWVEVPHHRCHATSAAYCSGFKNQVTLTLDGRGENESTVVWDENLNRIKEFTERNSLGYFYDNGCKYLGFRPGGWDAGKVMGLAPYGSYTEEFNEFFEELTSFGDGEYDVSEMGWFNNNIISHHLGPGREYPNELTQRHKDFAYHLQKRLEEIVCSLVEHYTEKLGVDNVALAGGVALNCKLNREILELDCVNDLFIQPAAGDSGICLGAALEGYQQEIDEPLDIEFSHAYYGSEYSNNQIRSKLNSAKLNWQKFGDDDICEKVAELLAEGKLVGWFQGRMEFGPRALGNRSILADPTSADSLDRVNANVKNREAWRPFAPSLLFDARKEYLVGGDESPFMILLDTIKDEKRDEVPAVTHVDGTTRPQTVQKSQNERYYKLIKEFESQTGVPVVLNTSFNVAGEPIVESPSQAISDFYTTGLDALAMGDYLLQKPSR